MKYCSDCGCENIDEAQFCRNCGSKLNADVAKATQNTPNVKKAPQTDDISTNQIIRKLFYKTDTVTGEVRFAKAKTISIGVFFLMFLFGISVGSPGTSFAVVFIAAVLFGLVFAIPLYILGYVVGLIIERISQ